MFAKTSGGLLEKARETMPVKSKQKNTHRSVQNSFTCNFNIMENKCVLKLPSILQ